MDYMAQPIADIASMPRGGPNASCLDRALETDRLEYLDRDSDGDHRNDARKRGVVRALERTGELFGNHQRFAHLVLEEVADVPDPRILELGSGHGGLSAKVLEMHPTARLTVTDVEPDSVAAIAAGELGTHKRVVVRELDPRRRADDLGTERLFLMRCDCGKESITRLKNLNAKTHPTRSCGCTGGRPRKVA